ncbi:zinc finger C2H2-type protein [Fadolivirus algeromassiliense]|jgi:hypothetical protein|uniref:Zinc finger C2H2-type protein n=1 Tax=Fadolivirus FV1/VV64 TaxID=3070911 RepID=A0A7D3QWF4_9VIRU|nr:zinc finger C2H2-type protein [Fadolivirus algeromassiliense]QKF94506.1 zinc finger C2H2-type protein [Fadolivirus FV1/VV64]
MEKKEFKYVCDKCNFKCNTKARWENHIKTELHKTGTRKKRKDYKQPMKCEYCEYETKNITTLKIHKLNKHSTNEDREKGFTYYCKPCDFGSFSEDSMKIHNDTNKHKQCAKH